MDLMESIQKFIMETDCVCVCVCVWLCMCVCVPFAKLQYSNPYLNRYLKANKYDHNNRKNNSKHLLWIYSLRALVFLADGQCLTGHWTLYQHTIYS